MRADNQTLRRWSDIGQALTPVGVLFSGIAFGGIVLTLALQQRELQNQREELGILKDEQRRSSEVALRQLHTELIKMAIEDPELLEVWPPIEPNVGETKKDHYCNLILNLQKVAYETKTTIEVDELRGALAYLMTSRDVYLFWTKARAARIAVTESDADEDFFTRLIDHAYRNAVPPRRPGGGASVAVLAMGIRPLLHRR
ncbi:DUF6082 family protein [Actinophytocola sp.]|uniref:DUF6082 family protein n=1 Tax=Actinophytocola sp. TaxID=1872138 RepID=UPI0025C48ACB|nr:DUF6082 family protein [Actinophytocola sp.]